MSAGLIPNLLDERDLSSYNWDIIFRSISKAFLNFSDLIVICTLTELSSNPAFFYWFRNQTTSHLLIHQNFSSINESCWKISNCQKRCVCVCTCVWEVDLKSMTMETVPSHSQGSAKNDGMRKKPGMESKKKNSEQSQDFAIITAWNARYDQMRRSVRLLERLLMVYAMFSGLREFKRTKLRVV